MFLLKQISYSEFIKTSKNKQGFTFELVLFRKYIVRNTPLRFRQSHTYISTYFFECSINWKDLGTNQQLLQVKLLQQLSTAATEQ
jgi:hypothetical protein